jgi:ankyrin repeat protein
MYAASASVAEALLSRGADPNVLDAAGETPLMLAAWRGHPEVVAMLLAAGANPQVKRPPAGRTAAVTACELVEQKIAGWREMPPGEGIASRIEVLEQVRAMLLAAENRTSSSPEA